MRCSADPDDNLTRALRAHREAAGRGAKLVCLPELFRTPVLLPDARTTRASTWPSRSRARRPRRSAQVARETRRRRSSRRCSSGARPGVYHNTAVVIDADGTLARHLPQDAHPRRSALLREVLLHARRPRLPAPSTPRCGRIGTLVCWDQWYPGGGAADRAARAPRCSSTRRRSAGTRPRRPSTAPAQASRLADRSQRAHAIANGVYVAAVNRVGHERPGAAATASSSGAAASSPIRSAASSPRRRATSEEMLIVDLRSPRTRRRAPQLAVPARPPHRRLRRRSPGASSTNERGDRDAATAPDAAAALGFRMPAEWEPHAATWIAWPHEPRDWPGKFAADPLGLRARSCATSPRRAGAHPGRRRRGREARARRAPARSASTCERVELLPRRRPTASGRATTARSSSRDGDGEVAVDRLALQRLGEVPEPQARRRRQRRASRRGSSCASGSRPRRSAASRARRAGGRRHRRQRRGHAARDRGVPARRRAGAQPAASAREALEARARATTSACARCSGSGAASPATTRTATSTTWRASSTETHGRDRASRATPTTRTTSRCATTARGSSGMTDRRRAPAARASRCRCPRRSSSTASGCRRATRTSTSPTASVLVPTFNDPNDRDALEHAGRAVPDRAGGRHPRRRSGLGLRHAALPDAAGARGAYG